jgi:hypothetical protein
MMDINTNPQLDTSLEFIENNTIAVITMQGISREEIDRWFNTTTKVMTEWPDDKLILVIHDASHQRTALTPYMRSRINDLYKLKLEKKGYGAVIIPKSVAAQMIQLFLRYVKTDPLVFQFFFSKEEAIAWLKRSAAR